MASISSVISLFVLLLATYCYSVPIGTEFEYSTLHPEFVTDKIIAERETLPFTASFEETTIDPRIHMKRTKIVDHDKSDESDEFTTVHSISTEDKKQKRMFFDATTSRITERSDETEPIDDSAVEDKTSIKVDDAFPQKREDEHITFDITTSDVPTEESKVERNFDLDLVNTVESSTEFNSRASRFMENESGVSTFTEPTSSFESLAHSTGLLHSRTIPETDEHKIEGEQRDNQYPSINENLGTGKTRITDYFHEDASSIINQIVHEQHSSSFSEETILILFLLAAVLFCTLFLASIIAFVHLKKTIQRSSPITEMEAELDKQYDQLEK